jgi:hypothetical protein
MPVELGQLAGCNLIQSDMTQSWDQILIDMSLIAPHTGWAQVELSRLNPVLKPLRQLRYLTTWEVEMSSAAVPFDLRQKLIGSLLCRSGLRSLSTIRYPGTELDTYRDMGKQLLCV